MTRSRQNLRIPMRVLIPAGSSGLTSRSPNSDADHQTAIRVLGLALLIHMLRSPRFYERAAFAAIVLAALAALAGLDKESRAKSLARLRAWLSQQDDRLAGKVKDALS